MQFYTKCAVLKRVCAVWMKNCVILKFQFIAEKRKNIEKINLSKYGFLAPPVLHQREHRIRTFVS